jgi:hypothetical protein
MAYGGSTTHQAGYAVARCRPVPGARFESVYHYGLVYPTLWLVSNEIFVNFVIDLARSGVAESVLFRFGTARVPAGPALNGALPYYIIVNRTGRNDYVSIVIDIPSTLPYNPGTPGVFDSCVIS